ncbi:cellulose binding domain-containing protein [Phytomonospora sp. NPDC050363]|uniref:cellulose binding domain-containing protein n=1 Tax=Phytomonospora sp. NPDC050363 TaxID=3155642 RepID=UPI0033F2E424
MKLQRIALLLIPALLLALLPAAPANAAAAAKAVFSKDNSWASGYTGRYTITNTGTTPISAWNVVFTLPSGTTVGSYWDALVTNNGSGRYTAVNREYNGTIAPGGTAAFGWVSAGAGAPASCTLNGADCGGAPPGDDTTPPSVPTGLTVAGPTGNSLTVSWSPSTDNSGTVAAYELSRDNGAPVAVSGTSTVVTGLAQNTAYAFKVRAKDSAGNASAYSAAVSGRTNTDDPVPPAGDIHVAPYIDITRESPTLPQVASATGQKHFTLAFILGSSLGCDPQWGGTIPLKEPRIIGQVDQLRGMGGDVVIASGGAMGPYLENVCGTADALYNAYVKVLDATGSNHLDVDVEASIPHAMVNTALKRLVDTRGTTVSYTMRIQGQDYGMDPYSVQILQDAAAKGLSPIVNPMLMNFGYSGDWGQAMIAAANATLAQMRTIWPGKSDAQIKAQLGITPMIGRNDTGMTTTQAHARALLSWAQSNHIGFIGFWSVGRDNGGCPGGGLSPSCSGISQSLYEFTNIFKGFAG